MRNREVKWKQGKGPPSFPKWLKSYHLLFFAVIMILVFGAVIKQLSEV